MVPKMKNSMKNQIISFLNVKYSNRIFFLQKLCITSWTFCFLGCLTNTYTYICTIKTHTGDVLKFLTQNMQRLSAIVEAPINTIGILSNRGTDGTVHKVQNTVLAKEAFKKFIVEKTDVIAVVDRFVIFIACF